MKPLLLSLSMGGPIKNDAGEMVHQAEVALTTKGSKQSDITRIAIPKANTAEALEFILPLIKAFVEKHYPQPKTKTPENVHNLHD